MAFVGLYHFSKKIRDFIPRYYFCVKGCFSDILILKIGVEMNFWIITKNYAADQEKRSLGKLIYSCFDSRVQAESMGVKKPDWVVVQQVLEG